MGDGAHRSPELGVPAAGRSTPDRHARALWTLFEPVHAIVYFAPELPAAFASIGLRGFWRGYFAGRAAPLGPIGPGPVTALFNSFAPAMVHRALPAVWDLTSPDAALATRRAAAGAVLRRLVPAVPSGLLPALRQVATAADVAGCPLGAANTDLALPDDPHEQLWQLATTLRELRGDAHVAALVAHGLAGITAPVLRCGLDQDRGWLQAARGWTDAQWDAAAAALRREGLLGETAPTLAGRDRLHQAEEATNRAAASAWGVLDHDVLLAVASLLRPIALACGKVVPYPNPVGTREPWDPVADPTASQVALPA